MKNLLPHQIADADFLASKSFAGNFSGMGSGKTLSAIAALQSRGHQKKIWNGRKHLEITMQALAN